MITIRKAADRGTFDFGWLKTSHTFSFGEYRDPDHMGFRSLRVINDDVVAPGTGFPEHPHRDMEILTYVLSGALAHKDSTGSEEVVRNGDVQRMSAGGGIFHSEYNASRTEPVHLLQIWIRPSIRNAPPRYGQKHFPLESRRNRLALIAGPDGADGSLDIHADARMYASVLDAGTTVNHSLAPGRHAWLQVGRGEVSLNGTTLRAGDGAAVSEETALAVTASKESEFLLFDLA